MDNVQEVEFPFGENAKGELMQVTAAREKNRQWGQLPHFLQPYAAVMPLSTIDLATKDGRIDAYNAMAYQDMSVADAKDAEIEICGYLIHAAAMPDESTGETKPIVRVVLLCPDGSRYGGSSEGLARAIQGIVTVFGVGPWVPPIKVIPRERTSSRTKRRFHTLEIAK